MAECTGLFLVLVWCALWVGLAAGLAIGTGDSNYWQLCNGCWGGYGVNALGRSLYFYRWAGRFSKSKMPVRLVKGEGAGGQSLAFRPKPGAPGSGEA